MAQGTSWPLPLKGVSQLVTKWLVTSRHLHCGVDFPGWPGYELVRLRVDLIPLEKALAPYILNWQKAIKMDSPPVVLLATILFLLSLFLFTKFLTWEFCTHLKTSAGPLILNYTRHSWPLSSAGSLVRHTFCDTGHPFIWSSPRTRNIHLLPCCHYLF